MIAQTPHLAFRDNLCVFHVERESQFDLSTAKSLGV